MTNCGMFSTVYEPEKFPDPATILQFNRETVLLVNAGTANKCGGGKEQRSRGERFPLWLATDQEGPFALEVVGPRVDPFSKARSSRSRRKWARSSGWEPLHSARFHPAPPAGFALICVWKAGRHVVSRMAGTSGSFPPPQTACEGKPILNRTGLREIDERYGIDAGPRGRAARWCWPAGSRPKSSRHLPAASRSCCWRNRGRWRIRAVSASGPVDSLDGNRDREEHPALAPFPHSGFCDLQLSASSRAGWKRSP